MKNSVLPWYKRLADAVSTLSLGVVFILFIYGVGMRYLLNRPVSWTDEAVTVLTVWSVLWTGAFVLRWSEHISFDIVFVNLAPKQQRLMLLVGNVAFVILMLAALPGMVDYTLFLWREKTDMLEMRLDFVYAIFPIFFIAIAVRQLLSLWRLMSPSWQAELARWTGDEQRESP
jgi:TRAP-type C4-dicarboxylate transport system permease small subunit